MRFTKPNNRFREMQAKAGRAGQAETSTRPAHHQLLDVPAATGAHHTALRR
jgi:hypothetical protein